MAAYGNQHSNTHNNVTGYSSKGSINGYSVGIYGTWYQNDASKTGLYLDSWLQYNWFNNEVKGQELSSESYKSRGITASLETGYSLKLGEAKTHTGMINAFWLQPQAQITWMGVNANEHSESNGTHVQSTGNDNIQTRLGMRAYMLGHSIIDEGKNREFEPFVEANWIYTKKDYGVRINHVTDNISGTKNIGELKVGVESKINTNLHLWGNVAQQIGGEGYYDTQATLGVKYLF